MDIDRNQKGWLRGKKAVKVSLNPSGIIIDEKQERVEWGREEKGGGLLIPIHMPWQEMGIKK